MRAAKAQASLRIRAVSPEPPLLAHTGSKSKETFRQKARSLLPLNGGHAQLKFVMTECSKTQICLTRHILGREKIKLSGLILIWGSIGWMGIYWLNFNKISNYPLFFAIFDNFQHLVSIEHVDIGIWCRFCQGRNISLSFWYTSQVLYVGQNAENDIFLLVSSCLMSVLSQM